jgi:hypothetical protein
MKKIIGLLSLGSVLFFAACTDKPAEVQKEVIVVPAQPVIVVKEPVVKEPVDKNTTVTLDKNGVKVVTKKVDISVKKQ